MSTHLNRYLCFDHIIIGTHAIRRINQTSGRQCSNISMNIAVVSLECLRESADARDIVAADVAQQLHALGRKHARERVPALERQMAFAEFLAPLGAMPRID